MPPKPFKPPRPSGSSSKAGRPRKSIGGTSTTSSATPKSKAVSKAKLKAKMGGDNALGKTKRVSAAAAKILAEMGSLSSDSGEDDDDNDDEGGGEEEDGGEEVEEREVEEEQEEENGLGGREERIPEKLLAVLLNEFMNGEGKAGGTRISKDAVGAVGKYMDTFVREAVARAAWAREEALGEEGGGGGSFLEVEDLEKVCCYMIFNFQFVLLLQIWAWCWR